MAQRPKYGPLTPPPLPGVDFLTEYQAGMKGLFDAASLPLTAVGGTANALTASLAWDLDAGLLDGMKFTLTWAASNTGPMTLAINGAAPVNVLDATGAAMLSGSARTGTRALLEYIGGAFRVLVGADASAADQRFFWRYTASGVWAKPVGLTDDTMVTIEAIGGGGGGGASNTNANANGGGGGGAYAMLRARLGDLPASVAVAVAAGGVAGAAGGNSTFGTLLTAYGGGAGGNSNASFRGGHGGGGGLMGAGGTGGNAASSAGTDAAGGTMGGGSFAGSTPHATLPEGGGAGGGIGTGGNAYYGGAGAGGVSTRAGNGGAGLDAAGLAPGGGGGARAAGGRGEVRIWI